jgi:hypothetical protein
MATKLGKPWPRDAPGEPTTRRLRHRLRPAPLGTDKLALSDEVKIELDLEFIEPQEGKYQGCSTSMPRLQNRGAGAFCYPALVMLDSSDTLTRTTTNML